MSLLRRLAIAVVRKLLPEAVPNPGTALTLRSDTQLAPIADRRSECFFPTDRPSQTLYAPLPAPVQLVAVPAPPPRRHRRIVIVEETTWRS